MEPDGGRSIPERMEGRLEINVPRGNERLAEILRRVNEDDARYALWTASNVNAMDMAKGRSRIPFEEGSVSIHSVSAAAIEGVHIEAGDDRPVRLRIEMSNSAGVFQIDQLFRDKLRGSGLEEHIELEARVEGEEREKRLIRRFRI